VHGGTIGSRTTNCINIKRLSNHLTTLTVSAKPDTLEFGLNFWWIYWQTFATGPLFITCGTTKSCPNVTTEFCTYQKFGSKIDRGLKVSCRFTHKFVQSQYWTSAAQFVAMFHASWDFKSLVRIRSNIYIFLHICWMLEVILSGNWLNFLYWYQTSVCWKISMSSSIYTGCLSETRNIRECQRQTGKKARDYTWFPCGTTKTMAPTADFLSRWWQDKLTNNVTDDSVQIIQNRGFRSTHNHSIYTFPLCLVSLLHCI